MGDDGVTDHTVARYPFGHPWAYAAGDRCQECRAAWRVYQRDYARQNAARHKAEGHRRVCGGNWSGRLTVPTGPVRAHVRRLRSRGWTLARIADASGIPYNTLNSSFRLSRRIDAVRAERILAVGQSTAQRILNVLDTEGRVWLAELATLCGVDEGLVRREVYRLARSGRLEISESRVELADA